MVRLYEGVCSRADYAAVGRSGGWTGVQHAKGLLVDDHAVMGSTNWSTSSRSNSEVSCLVKSDGTDRQALQDVFWRVVLRSENFADGVVSGRIQAVAEDDLSRARRSRSLPRMA